MNRLFGSGNQLAGDRDRPGTTKKALGFEVPVDLIEPLEHSIGRAAMMLQSTMLGAAVVSLAMIGPAAAGAHGGATVTKSTTSGFPGNVTDHRGDYRHRQFGGGYPNGGWRPTNGNSSVRDHR